MYFAFSLHFFDTTFFLSLVTLLVGLIALYIYSKQHKDERREAAQAIINEIISAENKLTGIRQRFFATEAPSLEPVHVIEEPSWSKYKHLFVEPLTSDEWNQIDTFYSNCALYDSAVETEEKLFFTRISKNFTGLYKYYFEVVKAHHKANPTKPLFNKKEKDDIQGFISAFLENIVNSTFGYSPRKTTTDARVALVALDTSVSKSRAGEKLKKLSGLKFDNA